VNTSTANQQQIGGDIANSTGQMAADIELIKAACKEQSECSMQIFSSVDSVKESTYGNLDAAKIMEKGVESLRTQIDILKNEIRQVQISAGKPSDEQ
jgi:methyl-accepting chemotaxis protein